MTSCFLGQLESEDVFFPDSDDRAGIGGEYDSGQGHEGAGDDRLLLAERPSGRERSRITSGTIWLGIGCMLLFMICHMLVLSWADYSFVMPFSAVTYALVPVLGYIWLGEYVPVPRRIGILLIVFGVFLVSRTPPRTTEPQAIAARSLN